MRGVQHVGLAGRVVCSQIGFQNVWCEARMMSGVKHAGLQAAWWEGKSACRKRGVKLAGQVV